jgi:hypothetical protein
VIHGHGAEGAPTDDTAGEPADEAGEPVDGTTHTSEDGALVGGVPAGAAARTEKITLKARKRKREDSSDDEDEDDYSVHSDNENNSDDDVDDDDDDDRGDENDGVDEGDEAEVAYDPPNADGWITEKYYFNIKIYGNSSLKIGKRCYWTDQKNQLLVNYVVFKH